MGHSVEPFAGAPGALADVQWGGVVATRANELLDELVDTYLLGQRRRVDAQQRAR